MASWRPLPSFRGLPALLVSPRFASSSYTLYITDFANIWQETLDRRGILLRSLQENTSVDLSDPDPEQWAVFLSKLQAAFDPQSPDHHLTSLTISASSKPGDTDDLALDVKCVLPKPLQPLKWPVFLTKCPHSSLTSEFVFPLVQAQYAQNQEIEDLMNRLEDKDAVITKLIDKLGAMGTGLEHVFNSLSVKRKVTRAAAEEKVKGLATFHEQDWKADLNSKREITQDVPTLVRNVFGTTAFQYDSEVEIANSSQLKDNWWKSLEATSTTVVEPQETTIPKHFPVGAPLRTIPSTGKGDDDDFQVQATPPRQQTRKTVRGDHSTSTDESDDDDSPEAVPDSHPLPPLEKPRLRIGALGGTKNIASQSSASQSSRIVPIEGDETVSGSDKEAAGKSRPKAPDKGIVTARSSKKILSPTAKLPSPTSQPRKEDTETASSSSSEDENKSKRQSSPKTGSSPATNRGLGRIGGNLKVMPAPSQAPRATTPGSSATASPGKPTGRKIGAIGKKTAIDDRRTRSTSPAQEEESETEEQKAGRKRAQLAKELERKATAPAKKKRRF